MFHGLNLSLSVSEQGGGDRAEDVSDWAKI